ncbi:MAG: peptidylprolyl isomerase [Bacteroidetes bacterium]|nr:peptidylprolyl isomerase [Bacteroidota bacterium]
MKRILILSILLSLSFASFAKKHKNKFVTIETTMGTMKVEVFKETPQHSENFLKLADEGFYDSLLFHRVIPNFMIQGGDPDSKRAESGKMLGNGDVGYKVPAEFMDTFYHKKGALAAARDNNPEKASSGCQFYIVQGKTFTDDDLNKLEASKGKKYTEQVRNDYKTNGGTPHLDGAYTVFGQLVEGFDVLEKISHTACAASDRPIEDVRIISMKVTKK